MTSEAKQRILELKNQGLGYKAIAKATGVSVGSVQHFLKNYQPLEFISCKNCGKTVQLKPKVKRRIFCSNACRQSWWNRNQNLLKKKKMHDFICLECGTVFHQYGTKPRKYCSLVCYISHRKDEASSNE